MSAGAWARDIARTYDALAENFESRPSTPENRLGAIANRAEAAKYHSIAARMDATGVSDRMAQQPADPARCPKCGGPHPFHDPACVVHPDLIQDHADGSE